MEITQGDEIRHDNLPGLSYYAMVEMSKLEKLMAILAAAARRAENAVNVTHFGAGFRRKSPDWKYIDVDCQTCKANEHPCYNLAGDLVEYLAQQSSRKLSDRETDLIIEGWKAASSRASCVDASVIERWIAERANRDADKRDFQTRLEDEIRKKLAELESKPEEPSKK